MRKCIKRIATELLAAVVAFTTVPMDAFAAEPDTTVEAASVSNNDLTADIAQDETTKEVVLPVYQATSGTFGNNNGFSWNYDESTATLIVTGEDSGLDELRSDIPNAVLKITKNIVFQDCVVSGSLNSLLYRLDQIESVEFHNFDTHNVTDMSFMFYECINLSSVDVSGFDTVNVTNMSYMFDFCSSLNDLDVSGFDTSNVTDMSCMFRGCRNLSNLEVSGFDTGNVTNMCCMFANCDNLCDLNVSNFNTTNVTNMRAMFAGKMSSLDISSFDAGNVTEMSDMFSGCDKLETIKTPKNIAKGVSSELPYWFTNDSQDKIITHITSDICDMVLMRYTKPTFGDNGGFSWSYDESTGTLTVTGDDSGLNMLKKSGASTVLDDTKQIVFRDCVVSGSMSELLSLLTNLQEVEFDNVDTRAVTDMSGMLYYCKSLTNVDLSDLDTDNVTNMSCMFYVCPSLTNVDLRGLNTSKVTDMRGMFGDCTSLTSVDLSGLDISNASYEYYHFSMFGACENLEIIKTPKYVNEEIGIPLPKVFYDADGNETWSVTSEFCNKVLTAERPEVKYTITYYLDGGLNHGANPATYINESDTIILQAPTKKGYVFKGWYEDSKFKKKVTQIAKGSTGNVALYAKWEKEIYKITYKLNGGTNKGSNPMKYDVTTKTIKLKAPAKKGYTFKGWYKDSKYKKKITQIKKGSTGKITLYAQWTPIKYTIKFNGNGATSGKMKNLTNRKYDTSYKLTANAFKKKGYKFAGWNTKKNGKGKSYKNKASVKNLISTNGKTVTLYAQWK